MKRISERRLHPAFCLTLSLHVVAAFAVSARRQETRNEEAWQGDAGEGPPLTAGAQPLATSTPAAGAAEDEAEPRLNNRIQVRLLGKDVTLPVTPMGITSIVMFVVLNVVIGGCIGGKTKAFRGEGATRTAKGVATGVAIGLVLGIGINVLSLQAIRHPQHHQDDMVLTLGPDPGTYLPSVMKYVHRYKIEPANGVAWRTASPEASPEAEETRLRPLLWLHFQKEAGTFVCLAAAANGERIVAPSENCNWKDFDTHEGAGDGALDMQNRSFPTCKERLDYFTRWNFTYGSISRELHGSDLCPEFRYAAALREPLHTMESNSFKLSLSKELLGKVFSKRKRKTQETFPGWKLFDNYKIRTVLGEEAFNLGPGAITQEHLHKAIERLHAFDLVKVLDIEASSKDWDGTSPELGWDQRVRRRVNNRKKAGNPKFLAFDEATKKKLEEINKWDMRLYQHFANQAQQDVKVQRTMARRSFSRLLGKMKKKRAAGATAANATEVSLKRERRRNATQNNASDGNDQEAGKRQARKQRRTKAVENSTL